VINAKDQAAVNDRPSDPLGDAMRLGAKQRLRVAELMWMLMP